MPLYDYFTKELGKPLPSVQERAGDAAKAGISGYTGTASQNNILERYYRTNAGGGSPAPAPTPAPSPTPAPATPPAPAEDPLRYARTAPSKAQLDLDAAQKQLGDELQKGGGLTPEQIAEKKAAADAMINAITQEFNRTISSEMEAGSARENRTRALNSSFGNQGSDFATAAAMKTEKYNKDNIDSLNAEKAAKIQAVLADIDFRYDEKFSKERESRLKEFEANIGLKKEFLAQQKAKATESIKSLASSGVKLDKLKLVDPKTYNQLLEESGGSPLDLESQWNAALPDSMKIKYKEKMTKGADGRAVVHRYGIDPMTGQIQESSYALDIPYETIADGEMDETKDGRIIMKYPDGTIKYLTDIDAKTASEIAENKASAAASYASANKNNIEAKYIKDQGGQAGFKFTSTQKTKMLAANFTEAKINAIQADLKEYGVKAVLDGLETQEEKTAVTEALKSSSLADQLAELLK